MPFDTMHTTHQNRRTTLASLGALPLAALAGGRRAGEVAATRRRAKQRHARTRSGTVTALHTYRVTTAWEMAQTIPVRAATLRPLLPDGYALLPADALGLGGADQGIVVIVNFQGRDPVIDQRPPARHDRIAIDVGIVVAAPATAAAAGLDVPGAFHFYTLAMYSDDAPYAASLRAAGMPMTLLPQITYDRQIDDASGVGTLTVRVPDRRAPFHSRTEAVGYQPVAAFDAIFWHAARQGVLALQFHLDPVRQGQALSQLSAAPESRWGRLLLDGGLGPCPADPASGDGCVRTPALNLRYDQGDIGRLFRID
jgi:hypothetical protein